MKKILSLSLLSLILLSSSVLAVTGEGSRAGDEGSEVGDSKKTRFYYDRGYKTDVRQSTTIGNYVFVKVKGSQNPAEVFSGYEFTKAFGGKNTVTFRVTVPENESAIDLANKFYKSGSVFYSQPSMIEVMEER